ncbi:unnamed protein product [Trichogramma brassicae]|uniref:Uncharacterized protein n=1 Tax=Trichogramma brassicae TaxID=86971 RepID=A0A6H5HZN3_9HYME|nr:unnamed protein product [Trichogramma brassicae]
MSSNDPWSNAEFAVGFSRPFLNFLGVWPYNDTEYPKIYKNFSDFRFHFVLLLCLNLILIPQTTKLYFAEGDLDLIIDILSTAVLPVIVACMKIVAMRYNSEGKYVRLGISPRMSKRNITRRYMIHSSARSTRPDVRRLAPFRRPPTRSNPSDALERPIGPSDRHPLHRRRLRDFRHFLRPSPRGDVAQAGAELPHGVALSRCLDALALVRDALVPPGRHDLRRHHGLRGDRRLLRRARDASLRTVPAADRGLLRARGRPRGLVAGDERDRRATQRAQ